MKKRKQNMNEEEEPCCGSNVCRVTLRESFLSSSLGPPCPEISFPYCLGNAYVPSKQVIYSLKAGVFLAQLIDSLIKATTFSIAYQWTHTTVWRSLHQDDYFHWPKLFPCYFTLTSSFLMVLILRRTSLDIWGFQAKISGNTFSSFTPK